MQAKTESGISAGRWLMCLALLLAVGLIAAACGGPDDTAADPDETDEDRDDTAADDDDTDDDATEEAAPEEAEEPFELTVGLNFQVALAEWAGMVTADVLGYYEEETLTVDFQHLAGSVAAVSTTGAGSADIGFAGPDPFLAGLSEGLPMTAVAAGLQINPTGVIALPDSGIETLADLDGKSVSTALASPEPHILQSLVPSDIDVELVYVDPQAKCSTMLAGGSDACTGLVNFQPIQVENEIGEWPNFISFSTPEQPIIGTVFFAYNPFLEQNPDVVQRFLRATLRGWEEAEQDIEVTLDRYEEVYDDFDRDFMRRALEITSEQLIVSEISDEHGWGYMAEEQWQGLHDMLLEGEMIEQELPLHEIYTNEHLPDDRFDWP